MALAAVLCASFILVLAGEDAVLSKLESTATAGFGLFRLPSSRALSSCRRRWSVRVAVPVSGVGSKAAFGGLGDRLAAAWAMGASDLACAVEAIDVGVSGATDSGNGPDVCGVSARVAAAMKAVWSGFEL
jgi:hypothetical protein